jgi:hypothetical protein
MKISRELWCRGSDCKHHPINKLFKKRTILKHCLRCKRFVLRDIYLENK